MKIGSTFKAAAMAILAAGAAGASPVPQGQETAERTQGPWERFRIASETMSVADASDPATVETLLKIEEEIEWLARNMFFEARGQSKAGKIAVGFVVMNRVRSSSFPNTVREVIEAPRQFSWTHDGKSDDPMKYVRRSVVDGRSWARCKLFAFQIYTGERRNPLPGSFNYHSARIKPPVWTKRLRRAGKIGGHVFYRGRG